MSDHVGFARVFIELINENDNRPIFSKPLYNISLPENTAPGTSLLRILVSVIKYPCRVCCDLFLKFAHLTLTLFTAGVFLTYLWAYCVSIWVLIMETQIRLPRNKANQRWCCGLALKHFSLPIVMPYCLESRGCVLTSCHFDKQIVVKMPLWHICIW